MEMNQQDVNDNTAQNDTVSAEDMFVDDLLDFSKVVTQDEFALCTKIEDETAPFHLGTINVGNTDSPLVPVHEPQLCLPVDEQENLEWLSNFVDDSTPGYSLTIPVENIWAKPDLKLSVKENGTVKFSVQTKARSKRVRNSVRVWSLSESTSSSSSSSSSCSPLNQLVLYNGVTQSAEKQLVKKQKKNGEELRRCSHCLVQKTPQWRAGPMGAKTLCNACGVRYKSGRLLPEYRPAISPTFSSEKHSNNHRKVMEMRRKKGGSGFVMPVETF